MASPHGNRKQWLLKSTSVHHAPERVALAIALGGLAGLVPKDNLLAVVLYAALVFLPVHTVVGVLVSVPVWLVSQRLDGVSHEIGSYLLTMSALRPLWRSLDSMPVLPWLALHNTVVLGSLMLGLVAFGPVYLLSLRLAQRWTFGPRKPWQSKTSGTGAWAHGFAPAEPAVPLVAPQQPDRRRGQRSDRSDPSIDSTESIPVSPDASPSPLIIPPPNFNLAAATRGSAWLASLPDEEGASGVHDPQRAAAGGSGVPGSELINQWHIRGADGQTQKVTVSATAGDGRGASATRGPGLPAVHRPIKRVSPPGTDGWPVGPEHDQSMVAVNASASVFNTLQLAHNASDVLAWVDELLDECLAEEGMTIITRSAEDLLEHRRHQDASGSEQQTPQAGASGTIALALQPAAGGESLDADALDQPWLLETTIEIVRWVGSGPSVESDLLDASSNQMIASELMTEQTSPMQAPQLIRDWSSGGQLHSAGSIVEGTRRLSDSQAIDASGSAQAAKNLTAVQAHGLGSFQQLVMAQTDKSSGLREAGQVEPVRGECLAYLLGHLRQAREGKSS